MKVTVAFRKKLNKEISKMIKKNGGCYFDKLPIAQINDCLKKYDFELLNEDGTKFCAFFCGSNGRTAINYGKKGDIAEFSTLQFSWYEMPSGKYEITTYIS